jgi:hypothetical protein
MASASSAWRRARSAPWRSVAVGGGRRHDPRLLREHRRPRCAGPVRELGQDPLHDGEDLQVGGAGLHQVAEGVSGLCEGVEVLEPVGELDRAGARVPPPQGIVPSPATATE